MKRLSLILLALLSQFAHAADRPNILFIASDDLRPELGTYGTRSITPNLDALAASGVRFDHAYCNQAVCGASRISLMTGLYPERTGERSYHVTDWRKRWPADKIVTLNQHFKENGYNTIGLGKIYHGTGGPGVDPDNWSEWINVRGTQYANPESRENMRKSKALGKSRSRGPATEAGNPGGEDYADTNRAKKAVELIEGFAGKDQPFFLAVGFTKPHLPFNAPKKFWDLYDREDFKMPANAGIPPGYPEYASGHNIGEIRSYSDIPEETPFKEFPDELNKRLLHGYHACASYMDYNVGLVLDALEKSGQADNTIVVFWGDHGWKLGDHSSWCKHTNFECDTRVPLIIRAPGKAKTSSKALVELIDLYPTLCDLAGLEKPAHLQGESFTKTLAEPEKPHRAFAYSSYPHKGVVGHSIRDGQYRYTEWWEKDTDKLKDRALTNISADPGETTSALPDKTSEADAFSKTLRQRVQQVRKPAAKEKAAD